MRAYLAGPMSRIPQCNFPAFDAAATALRNEGWDIVSPSELDDPVDRAAALASVDGSPTASSKTWGDFLARDVKLIADGGIEAIVFLPNWQKSRGARLEATVGLLQGPQFKFFAYLGARPVFGPVMFLPRAWVADKIRAAWNYEVKTEAAA